MKELIDKFQTELDYSNKIKGYTPVFHLGIDEVEYIIQAITSVKSESAEEVLSNSEILTWFKTQNFQEEQGEQEYTMIYKIDLPEIIRKYIEYYKSMQDFANAEKKQHAIVEIDFGNHLKAKLRIIDNNIEVLGAINGWGNGVNQDEIKIEYLTTLNNK